MTKLEEIMLECCELTLEEVQKLHSFLDLLETRKKESAALLHAAECITLASPPTSTAPSAQRWE